MKKITIEQKAKAYDEVIEKLREFYRDYDTVSHLIDVKEELANRFPELKESEDERIRTFLHHTFTAQYLCKDKLGKWHGEPVVNILAWFEKQGEHKKFRDGIQVGDKVTRNRDGMIVNLSQLNRVAKKDENHGEQKHVFDVEIPFGTDSELVEETITIPDGCYAIIEDNKVILRKVEQKPAGNIESSTFKDKLLELFQKFRYIKESVPTNGDIIDYVDAHIQELIDTMQKPAEWSEEDKNMVRFIGNAITADEASAYLKSKGIYVIDAHVWLEELKERYTWKPSDEQMETLHDAIVYVEGCNSNFKGSGSVLEKLYNDLKKLKG